VVVPEGNQHTGEEIVWEAFVGHDVADDGTLRLWTRWWGYHPEEDTIELASRFDLRKVRGPTTVVYLISSSAIAEDDTDADAS